MIIVFSTSHSAEWFAEPSVIVSSQYDDNFYLRTTNELDTSSLIIDPNLRFEGQDERWSFKLDARFRAVKYYDISNTDSNNVFLKLKHSYLLESGQLGLSANLDRNTTFDRNYDTQLLEAGLSELQIERDTLTVEPYWDWKISEIISSRLNLKVTDIQHGDNAPSNYNDYNSQEISLMSNWSQTEKSVWGMILKSTHLEVSDLDYENEQRTVQVYYDHSYTENSKLSILGGKTKVAYLYNNYPVCTGFIDPFLGCVFGAYVLIDNESSSTVSEYSIGYAHANELGDFNLNAYRSVRSSSSGSATQNDALSINYLRKITERVSGEFLLVRDVTESIDGLDVNQDREVSRLQPSVSWKLSKYWNLSFRYRYIKQVITSTDVESTSNSILAVLSLKWPKLISIN
ncbi:MAG: hypothetical protein OEZ38_04130 [Gammaproteobacteria bacterium]|nr:hypothetical protein [Gammaproteobacteria bacterium]